MHRFNGYDIEITAGDSLFFNIRLEGRELPDGAAATFTVKRNPKDDEALIEKEIAVNDGQVEIPLFSADTDLPARTYFWDLRVRFFSDKGEEVETPMEYAAFTVLQPVGDVNGG